MSHVEVIRMTVNFAPNFKSVRANVAEVPYFKCSSGGLSLDEMKNCAIITLNKKIIIISYVERNYKSDANNNSNNWNHLKIIRKISEQITTSRDCRKLPNWTLPRT